MSYKKLSFSLPYEDFKVKVLAPKEFFIVIAFTQTYWADFVP